MLRTRTSRWSVGTVALCLVLLVVAWLLLIAPRRADAAALSDRQLTTQQQNEQLQIRIEQLKAQSGQLAAYRAELGGILKQLPPAADMPQLVRDLNSLAAAAGVVVDTLTPSSAAALKSAPGSASAGTTSASASGGTSGVVQIPISVVVHGDYFQTVAFLQKLQTQLSRAFLVTGAAVAPSSGASGQIQLSITGQVFVWPAGSAVTTDSTGTSGAQTSTPNATATTGATP
jgi:Tfp pilus assembly protein PilO